MDNMKVIEGRNGCVWPQALQTAAESRAHGRRVILYVPEQMTLQAERDLIAGLDLNGLLNIEVISPKKLRMLVREKAGGNDLRMLDKSGQVMAVHRAMTEAAEELTFYKNMTELPGAVEKIREALAELRESEITPEETETYAAEAGTGAVQAKLRDMNRIRDAYETLVSEHFDDEKTAWTDVVSRLGKTDLLRGADFIAYGFDTIRPDLRELLCAVYSLAEDCHVFLTADEPDAPDGAVFQEQQRSLRQLQEALTAAGGEIRTVRITAPREDCGEMLRWMESRLFTEQMEQYPGETGDGITLYAASNREDEAEQVAECLLDWHGKGIAWDRMAIALPKQSTLKEAILARLRLCGIPFYTAEKTPAASHGVCRMLTAALECIAEGYTFEHAADAALSGFTSLEEEEAMLVVDYAQAHGIDGNRWREPFGKGTDAEAADKARRKLTDPIEHLRMNLKEAGTATESVEAIVRFLEEEGVWKRLQAREEILLRDGLFREAVADRQVWKLLTEILDQLWTLLGSRRASIRDLKNMLECALNGVEISTLPETESGVALGEVGHMQAGIPDALILPGCQEGVLTAADAGWLSDRERDSLSSATGREVGLTRERRGWIRKFDFYRTMTAPRKYLRISWSLQDGKGSPQQEDGLISRVRTIFPGIHVMGGVHGSGESFSSLTPMRAMESMGILFGEKQEGRRREDGDSAVIALLYDGIYGRTVREMVEEEFRSGKDVPVLQADTARTLFHTDVTSISRLERYAACPYQHFIDYGLRPVRQENYDFDSAAAGSFFHEALDRYVKTAGSEEDWPEIPDERVDGIMDGICAELTKEWEGGPLREDAMGIWQGEEYLRRIHYTARVLTRFAANSDFRTIATEQSFGHGTIPPLTLRLADGSKTEIKGIIDRIDTYENGEGIWLRVVDNKSAFKKPEPAKMADGEQLQLMIYLKAAGQAWPGSRPAGAMFFPIQDPETQAEDETPETTEADRLKKMRMKGIVNAREDVLHAMDRDVRPCSVDDIFNKDGSVRKNVNWAVEEDVLHGLMDAAEQKATEICDEIRSGRIEPSPRGKAEEDSPCRYCSYRTLCRRNGEPVRPREEGITFRDIAREAAGKITLREDEK